MLLPYTEDSVLLRLRKPLYTDEKGLSRLLRDHVNIKGVGQHVNSDTYAARTLRLLTVDFVEHRLQAVLEYFVLSSLVKLADKVPTSFQRLKGELSGRMAEILDAHPVSKQPGWRQPLTDHATGMIPKVVAARIHHPKIRVTQTSFPEPSGLLPGLAHVAQHHINIFLRINVGLMPFLGIV